MFGLRPKSCTCHARAISVETHRSDSWNCGATWFRATERLVMPWMNWTVECYTQVWAEVLGGAGRYTLGRHEVQQFFSASGPRASVLAWCRGVGRVGALWP